MDHIQVAPEGIQREIPVKEPERQKSLQKITVR